MKKLSLSFLALLLAGTLLASPAFAKKPEHAGKADKGHKEMMSEERGGDRGGSHDGDRGGDSLNISLNFSDGHRSDVRSYLRENYGAHCPPGLAKKNNGCLPPGQAKKYTIGGMLPHGYDPVPHDLLMRLGPPPAGAFYAMVDKDVVLATEGTKKILDAVTLFSAMGH
ncbi:MAG TPA: hypothetical protein DCY07_08940 [Rhodospirillaceae bacterium]|nr:hypothetical protein [Rhodospirillaceae bacterium]